MTRELVPATEAAQLDLVSSSRAHRVAAGVLAVALTLCLIMASASPGLAAQNGVIVFQRGVRLMSVLPNGQGLRFIGLGRAGGLSPGTLSEGGAFSPDGQRIIFADSTANSGSGIFTIGVDGGGLGTLLSSPQVSSTNPSALTFNSPSYFPNGQEIVFAAVEGFGSEYRIYASRLDGSVPRQLTSGHEDFEPVVSPDGAEIIFDRSWSQWRRSAVYIMSSAGSVPRRISARHCNAGAVPGSFTPDGSRIVFSQHCGRGGFALFTMAPGGSHLRRLTRARPGVRDVNPVFSPDGQSVAFLRIPKHGQGRIFTIGANGFGLRRIANDATAGPIWQPLP